MNPEKFDFKSDESEAKTANNADQSKQFDNNKKNTLDDFKDIKNVDPEFIRMYYEHHYDRVSKLEEQGLIITNVAMTFSVVVFTFGFGNIQSLNIVTGVLLPLTMIFVNAFAVGYLIASRNWISSHRKRAERVLEIFAKDIYLLDRAIFNSYKPGFMGRHKAQLFIHYILIGLAVAPIIIYLSSLI
ncbi:MULTISPECIES: hypothetical protein [Cyanophyceae]|uniref:hypothetical protein n=1 Tax=Cyanophyceae TaxID=3028117 RepID=UPI001681C89F|nr:MULTISPECIES: hypothetical protein [Cyanophyceae]MBD1914269.1 hypothetical protein [Phormidium sp. FACHB-77]MBD2031204.1 hypothetical protein [Phormidium sp. FACHB-322]MBD2049603.1 hypothetical protein [Leptolyngbya sp. FACHB-60]